MTNIVKDVGRCALLFVATVATLFLFAASVALSKFAGGIGLVEGVFARLESAAPVECDDLTTKGTGD
jgi:hypothetical protein